MFLVTPVTGPSSSSIAPLAARGRGEGREGGPAIRRTARRGRRPARGRARAPVPAAETSRLSARRAARDLPERAAPAAIEHRADEEAHHVVQEAVRLDLERQAALPLVPARASRRCSGGRSSAGAVPCTANARKQWSPTSAAAAASSRVARRAGARTRHSQSPPERRVRRVVGADEIAVPPATPRRSARGTRAASRAPRRPTRRREHGVHRAPQLGRRPACGHAHARRLAARVHPGVGAPRAGDGERARAHRRASAASSSPCTVRAAGCRCHPAKRAPS